MMSRPAYYLGCPVWACERWAGQLYTRRAKRHEWLGQYARVFNTVEGNSTFYGLPKPETVRRWCEQTPPGFRFVLKFPRAISHDKRLLEAAADLSPFLRVLETLAAADRLGPAFLQLAPGFSAAHLPDLKSFLRSLPRQFPYAVEPRHPDFFDRSRAETALNALLAECNIDRVILDSHALFSAPPSDPFEAESQRRKPQLPVHLHTTGRHPIVRLIGRDEPGRNVPWIHQWSPIVARWIDQGLQPFVFTHTPADVFAPAFARMFHQSLQQHCGAVDDLAAWPGEIESSASRQLELF